MIRFFASKEHLPNLLPNKEINYPTEKGKRKRKEKKTGEKTKSKEQENAPLVQIQTTKQMTHNVLRVTP